MNYYTFVPRCSSFFHNISNGKFESLSLFEVALRHTHLQTFFFQNRKMRLQSHCTGEDFNLLRRRAYFIYFTRSRKCFQIVVDSIEFNYCRSNFLLNLKFQSRMGKLEYTMSSNNMILIYAKFPSVVVIKDRRSDRGIRLMIQRFEPNGI